MLKRTVLTALAAVAMLAFAASANAAYLSLGTTNTSNATTTLTGNAATSELLVKNTNGSSASAFGLYGLLTATAPSVNAAAVRGHNSSTNALGYGVWGSQAGTGTGVYGTASNGIGVYGRHLGSTGTGPGVKGQSLSASAPGVLGSNSAGGPGVQALVTSNAVPPLAVNSTHVVPNLHAANSDALGGKGPGQYWQLGGNSIGGTGVLGTTDNNALEFRVDGARALRLEPDLLSPNVIGGFSGNAVQDSAYGATIAGGGQTGNSNRVTDTFDTVSGGLSNVAGNTDGYPFNAGFATVSGGDGNVASGAQSAVAGGEGNVASGDHSAVAGGHSNGASGSLSAVGGGYSNAASGSNSTVAAGYDNTANGPYSTGRWRLRQRGERLRLHGRRRPKHGERRFLRRPRGRIQLGERHRQLRRRQQRQGDQ
jgi:hypothetical protein